MALRAIRHIPLDVAPGRAFDGFTLAAQDRNIRRKLLVTDDEKLEVLIDLQRPIFAGDGDHLELEDGRFLEVLAAEEDLYEVRGVSPRHVVALAWQLGNRHLPAQLEWDRILILRDPVIRTMLEKLQATVTEVREQFFPEQGAYAAHGPFGHGH